MSAPVRVLLIEDSKADAALIRAYFRRGAMDVSLTRADCLQMGVSLLESASFDVVLLDQNLPDARGEEGIRTLRGLESCPPIVLLTGNRSEAVRSRALEAGAAGYLGKDHLDGTSLFGAVMEALET